MSPRSVTTLLIRVGALIAFLGVGLSPAVGSRPAQAAAATGASGVRQDPSIKDLERDLADRDEKKRRSAVNKLVAMDTRAAWLVVVEALANDKGMPADEAQLDLASVTDEKVLEALWGRGGLKAKDPLVRLRVAELLGRRAMGVESKALAKALKERDPEVRRVLCWSIERLAEAGHLTGEPERQLLPELEKLMRNDGAGAVRGAALFAYLAIAGPEPTRSWAAKLATERKLPAARAAVARLAGRLEAPELLLGLAGDERSAVRKAAVVGLEQLVAAGDRSCLAILIERLEVEPRPRVRWALVDALQRLSGMGYRTDVRPWRRWLEGLDEDWTPASGAEDGGGRNDAGSARERDEATVAFAGLPLLSDRVAFLIDFSGSIWTEKDGKLPKDLVGTELERVLERLDDQTWFNLIPYINDPVPWGEELVRAKPKAVAAAKQFYADCRARGAGDVYDAIQLALQDPEVDTIMILTDGAPSGGSRWNLNLMIPALVEQNRYRSVAFDSLLVGAKGGLARHWQALAEATGGECISIELQ